MELHANKKIQPWTPRVPVSEIKEQFRKWVGCHQLIVSGWSNGTDIEFEILQNQMEKEFPGRSLWINNDGYDALLVDKHPDKEIISFARERMKDWEEDGSFDADRFQEIFDERVESYWEKEMSIVNRIHHLKMIGEPLSVCLETNVAKLPERVFNDIHDMLSEML